MWKVNPRCFSGAPGKLNVTLSTVAVQEENGKEIEGNQIRKHYQSIRRVGDYEDEQKEVEGLGDKMWG